MVETKLKPEEEFKDAFDLIGPVLETFVNRSTYYEPVPHKNDGLFITKSMDSTSHFESAT